MLVLMISPVSNRFSRAVRSRPCMPAPAVEMRLTEAQRRPHWQRSACERVSSSQPSGGNCNHRRLNCDRRSRRHFGPIDSPASESVCVRVRHQPGDHAGPSRHSPETSRDATFADPLVSLSTNTTGAGEQFLCLEPRQVLQRSLERLWCSLVKVQTQIEIWIVEGIHA